MSNPFGEPDAMENTGEILEGFICPICREDLRSLEFLTQHFERAHAEDKNIFKDIISIAKQKIRQNFEDSFDLSRALDKNASITEYANGTNGAGSSNNFTNARTRINVYNFMQQQEVGVERSHLEYFQSVRNPRLERYASETNKLIIRLHKLLKDMPTDPMQRKQHEQKIVAWLDGSSVKLCPNCAKSFHLARRQHHCRLCGSIMCHDCSQFLAINVAMELASLSMSQNEVNKANNNSQNNSAQQQQSSIRCCEHCLWLLETRQEMHESRTCNPPIAQLYANIQKLRKDVLPDAEMYSKMINSLYEGESIFTLTDASRLRGKIGKVAEAVDVYSKRILAIPCMEGSREEVIKKAVRLASIQLIKEHLLSLPPLPVEAEIRKIQERKRMETEQRIETERRMAMEAYERYELQSNNTQPTSINNTNYAQGSDLHSLDNWSAHQVNTNTAGHMSNNDPLVEQINIIKGYIKQARQDMNFDVVETLELNLRDLQREFYERQRSSNAAENQTTINDS